MFATITLLMMVAISVFCLCTGLLAIFKGWVPPWLRRRVVSAREWGIGVLILGLGVGMERLVFTVGLVLFLVGLGATQWAQMGWRRRRAGKDG
jgi:hypothetical protein